jgi:hypothetical protein
MVQASVVQTRRSYEHKSRNYDWHDKRRHQSNSTKFSKINEQASHHRHRLSQSSNRDGSRTLVGQLTYRPRINRGNLCQSGPGQHRPRKHRCRQRWSIKFGTGKSRRTL